MLFYFLHLRLPLPRLSLSLHVSLALPVTMPNDPVHRRQIESSSLQPTSTLKHIGAFVHFPGGGKRL